ncbi:hypothetical protein [Rhizohabitans arisaemae]|nr:hypothetical protein [Rhizohabitans arisaemae]
MQADIIRRQPGGGDPDPITTLTGAPVPMNSAGARRARELTG